MTQGQKVEYNGMGVDGRKRFKAVSALREETGRKMRTIPRATPGSWVEFPINPTITALTTLSTIPGYTSASDEASHLNTEGLLDVLSGDFSRTLKDLAAVFNDLKRLSALGDLPITYQGSSLRIHFPGCDADTVEGLCSELGVQRGVVVQDEAFDAFAGTEIALLFPFAPSTEPSLTAGSCASELYDYPTKSAMASQRHIINFSDMMTLSGSPAYSTLSDTGFEDIIDAEVENPWLSSPSDYQSVRSRSDAYGSDRHDPLEYQGFEGIYRFIEQLDSVRR
jgi:hypothetical protein